MTPWIIIGICVALFIGAVIGWKAREWVDEFEHDIEQIFQNALKEFE
jgi:Na+/H+-dicarboxylate symporter